MPGLTAEVATTTTTTTHCTRSSKLGQKIVELNPIRPQLQMKCNNGGSNNNNNPFPLDNKSLLSPVHCCAIFRVSARFGSSVLVTGGLLLLSELEVLAARDDELLLLLALLALQPKGNLLCGLGLDESWE